MRPERQGQQDARHVGDTQDSSGGERHQPIERHQAHHAGAQELHRQRFAPAGVDHDEAADDEEHVNASLAQPGRHAVGMLGDHRHSSQPAQILD